MTNEAKRSKISELVNDLWVYECSNCNYISKDKHIPTAPICPSCGSSFVSENGYVSRRQIAKVRGSQ